MFSIQSNTGCLDSCYRGVIKTSINTLGSVNTKLSQGKKNTVTFSHRTTFEENPDAFLFILNTGLVPCLYKKIDLSSF